MRLMGLKIEEPLYQTEAAENTRGVGWATESL
jgi:hypothetical protein